MTDIRVRQGPPQYLFQIKYTSKFYLTYWTGQTYDRQLSRQPTSLVPVENARLFRRVFLIAKDSGFGSSEAGAAKAGAVRTVVYVVRRGGVVLIVNMGAAASDLSWHDVRDMAPTELADLVRYVCTRTVRTILSGNVGAVLSLILVLN